MSEGATDDKIPVLSICQPWPWMILAGHKRIENRTWPTNYRGPLLIHASKSRKWMHAAAGLRQNGFRLPADDRLKYGAIVGVVELVDVVEYAGREDLQDDPFASGPLCWVLANARRFRTPFPARGNASLWYVERSTIGL